MPRPDFQYRADATASTIDLSVDLRINRKIAQTLFPMTQRDRRENAALLSPALGLDAAEMRKDGPFYSALADLLNADAPKVLVSYDQAMARAGKSHKQFGTRARREIERLRECMKSEGEPPSLQERATGMALQTLLNTLQDGWNAKAEAPENGEAGIEAEDRNREPTGAAPIAEALRALLGEDGAPDTDTAERIRALTEQLVVACREDVERAKRRHHAVIDRIEALPGNLSLPSETRIDAGMLDGIEDSLGRAEEAATDVATAGSRETDARTALRAASDDEQDACIGAVQARVKDRARAEEEFDDALAALAEALGLPAPIAPRDSGADPASGIVLPEPAPAEPRAAPEPGDGPGPDALLEPADAEPRAAPGAPAAKAPPPDAPDRPSPDPEPAAEPAVTAAVDPAPPPPAPSLPVPRKRTGPVASRTMPRTAAMRNSPVPATDIDTLLLTYLDAGETALAWHVARIAERNGEDVSIPAPVMEAAILGPAVSRPEDVTHPYMVRLFTEAVAMSGKEDAPSLLLTFGGLLRPALFDMHQATRNLVANLPRGGVLSPYAALMDALSALGYEVRVSVEILAEMAGMERVSRLPRVREGLREWLDIRRHQKTTSHQPTYFILHQELAPTGILGAIVEAALADAPGADREARAFVETYSGNRIAQENYVRESERRAGRSRRKEIKGRALEWFYRALQEACDRLSLWLEARGDTSILDDSRRSDIQSSIGTVRKAARAILAADAERKAGARSETLTCVAEAFAIRAVRDLLSAVDGTAPQGGDLDRDALLQEPRLRLTGGAQDWTGGAPGFDDERAAADARAMAALREPVHVAPDLASAFAARCGEDAILAATRLLDLLAEEGHDADECRHMRQRLEETLADTTKQARARVESLRQKLASLVWLETDRSQSVHSAVERMGRIAEALDRHPGAVCIPMEDQDLRSVDVPPDFPELRLCLDGVEGFYGELISKIRTDQRAALEALTADPKVGEDVVDYLDRIGEIDPVTIDNDIAGFRFGQTVTPPAREMPDPFRRFFPAFVDAIERENPLRGAVIAAVRNGGALGPLDFGAFDAEARHDTDLLLEKWGAMENALKNSRKGLRDHARAVFEALGFSSVAVKEDRDLVRKRLQTLRLTCDTPVAARWFLPPGFGTGAGGLYPVLAARGTSVEDLVTRLGAMGRDRPWILLVFGRYSSDQRAKLGRALRREGQVALVIDETLLFWLAMHRDERLKMLFTCASPFGWLQPYTTSAGHVPREMFFGRRDEIEKVTEMSSRGCLIYGGRQLGKSALLYHIRDRQHRPAEGSLALYLDIEPLGGIGRSSDEIWNELGHILHTEGVTPRRLHDAEAITGAITAWMDAAPDRRILAMFDESDNFLSAEHRTEYINLRKLKNLMESTRHRFKVVFAGLHNVRRMAQAPNSLLPHLHDPICIGPMNSTPENRSELLRLAIEPMRAAGLDYDDPYLASEMLTKMNFYPSLVQIFGRNIVEKMGRRPDPSEKGPRWTLKRDALFEGAAGEAIFREIRHRFHLTLELDPRYELIVKCIAHMRFEDGYDAEGSVRTLEEIDTYLTDWWPATLPRPDRGDLRELLDEMADLGVLGGYGDGRFGLRNAHIAQLLGPRDQLETEILELSEREGKADYDAALFHRELRPEWPGVRAPLPDRMLDRLFARGGVVVGSPAIAGPRIAERIVVAADMWNRPENGGLKPKACRVGTSPLDIGNCLRRDPPPSVLVVDGPWDEATAGCVIDHPTVRAGATVAIWVDEAARGDALAALATQAQALGVEVMRCGPWSDLMVRHWLRGQGLNLDAREMRKALMRVSGGLPARLFRMEPMLQTLATQPLAERARKLDEWAADNPLPDSLRPGPQDMEALRMIAEEDLVDLEDLQILCETATPETLVRLETLDLVRERVERDMRRLCPTPLGQLLAAS